MTPCVRDKEVPYSPAHRHCGPHSVYFVAPLQRGGFFWASPRNPARQHAREIMPRSSLSASDLAATVASMAFWMPHAVQKQLGLALPH
jgi:hypothetical protein